MSSKATRIQRRWIYVRGAPILLIAIISFAASSISGAGTVLKCVNKRGAITYSDRPLAENAGSSCAAVSVSGNVMNRGAPKPTSASNPSLGAGNFNTPSTTSGDLEQANAASGPSTPVAGSSSGGGGGGAAGAGALGRSQDAAAGSGDVSQSPAPGVSTSGGRKPSAATVSPQLPAQPPPPPLFGRNTTAPVATVRVESTQYNISSASVTQCNAAAPAMTSPTVQVDDFGAKGDGETDDTASINKAIQSLSTGGTVVFTRGKTYLKRGSVAVGRPGVKLWGYGAIVYSVVTDAETDARGAPIAVALLAPNTGVYGFTFISNLRTRMNGNPYNAGVYLASDSQEAVDNRFEYTGNGVYITGTNFLVTRNVVFRTWADGITMTHDARSGLYAGAGRVLCNMVRETGDDMISIVSYGLGAPTVGNILVEGNDVSGEYWGRGIAVIGGKDITIRNNVVSNTAAAGIIINSEAVYRTSNVQNVLVEGNQIREVQTAMPAYNPLGSPPRSPGQGGIDINAQLASQTVSQVLIRNNLIDHTGRDSIYIRNRSKDIGLVDNTLRTPGRDGIRIETSEQGETYCSGNILNGTLLTVAQCSAPPPTVTGAQF